MTFRKSILLLIGLSTIAALVACGGSSHTTTTPPPTITVSVSAVPTPLAVNSSNAVTATTTDTAGVNWSVTCASTGVACGTFSASQTATGVATNYIAPPAPTTNVVITATSVTTPTIMASTTPAITINGATLADGNYIFSLSGEDANGNYFVAGQITIAGGLITTGEQDFVDRTHDVPDLINGTSTTNGGSGLSTIAYTADGNVQITLVTCNGTGASACLSADTTIGPVSNPGTETLNGTILPLSTTGKAFITEFDASASASGQLELQPTGTFIAGTAPGPASYAFVVNGLSSAGLGSPLAIGGILNVDGAAGTGTISGTGSIFDANDVGTVFSSQPFLPSTVSPPDTLGRVTFTINSATFAPIILAGYIVDSSHIRLVETTDTYSGTLGGVAYTQASTGTFTTASAAGTYVVGMSGADPNGVLQVVSQLTLVAGAGVTGFLDYNDLATSSGTAPVTSPDPVTAAGYTVDTAGAGDITIAGVTDSGATLNSNVQLYLDGNGHALAITLDQGDVLAGAGFTQGAGPFAFTGNYGLDVTGADDTVNELELDGAGPVTATAGTISGTVDLNWLASSGPTYPATAVNGTFVTTGTGASNGVFTGTITGVDTVNCITVATCSVDNFSYYLIDATGDNIAIETDETQLTLGFFLQQ
jgi:hypothetical protein